MSVVITRLENVDEAIRDTVNEPVLLSDTPTPYIGAQVLQWLRLADAREGITARGLDQFEHLRGELAVVLHPVTQILERFRLQVDDPVRRVAPASHVLLSGFEALGQCFDRFEVDSA